MNPKQRNVIILILGALSAIAPFSIDMYLPGFPAIARDLGTSIGHVAYSLTSFFIGISFGQLIYGPLIDRYGRKKPLVIGLIIYILAAFGCAFSADVSWLIGLRLLQALGGCVGMVAGRAIVRDLFPVNETASVFSTLMLVMGVAPIIAPTIGGFVTSSLGWRAIFFVLVGISTLMLLAVVRFLPESKGPDASVSLKPGGILREYGEVGKESTFLIYAIVAGVSGAGMFAYIAGSPFVFMNLFGMTDTQYGWAFGLNAFGLILGSQVNRLWLKRQTSAQIAFTAGILQCIVGILLAAGTVWGGLPTAGTLALIWSYVFLVGLISPNATALALEPFTKFAGSASALFGGIQMVSGAVTSGLVSYFHNGTALPMVCGIAACGSISFGMLLIQRFFRMRERAGIGI